MWHFDGHGQDMPYLKGAQSVGDLMQFTLGGHTITYRDIVASDGGFIRVEYYASDSAQIANIQPILDTRMSYFANEQDNWATLACGSLSSVALEGRYYEQFVLNPQYKDPRKWYGAATECLERLIFMQRALRCNVVFMCHIGKDKDEVGGEFLFTPDLPGRLGHGAGRYFNEMYRVFVQQAEDGRRVRGVQTDNDGRFQCKTHIDAPSVIWSKTGKAGSPSYEDLWVNWR
jgi:hypothetical protein